jgi:hypothetical protein
MDHIGNHALGHNKAAWAIIAAFWIDQTGINKGAGLGRSGH